MKMTADVQSESSERMAMAIHHQDFQPARAIAQQDDRGGGLGGGDFVAHGS